MATRLSPRLAFGVFVVLRRQAGYQGDREQPFLTVSGVTQYRINTSAESPSDDPTTTSNRITNNTRARKSYTALFPLVEVLAALVRQPPHRHSPRFLGGQKSAFSEVPKTWECSLIREPNGVSNLSSKERRVLRLPEDTENLAIINRFLATTGHRPCVESQAPYYHVVGGFTEETKRLQTVSLVQTTKFPPFTRGVTGRTRGTVATRRFAVESGLGVSAPVRVWSRIRGTEPMSECTCRGLEIPARTDAPPPHRRVSRPESDLTDHDALPPGRVQGVVVWVTLNRPRTTRRAQYPQYDQSNV